MQAELSDVVHVDMVVDIRCSGDAGMSHEILCRFQVDALTAQIGAIGVPEIVGCDRWVKGVLDDLVAIQLSTGFPVTCAVEAAPHAPQVCEREHPAVLSVKEIPSGAVQLCKQRGRHRDKSLPGRSLGAFTLGLIAFGVGDGAADPQHRAVLAQVGLADRHGLAAPQAAVQHEQHPWPRPVLSGYLADERLLLAGQRTPRRLAGRGVFDAAAGRDLNQTIDLGLFEDLPQRVQDLPHRTLRQRLAVLTPGIIDELLQVVRPHGSQRHEPDHQKDMASQVGFVVNALARADLWLFVRVIPLPRPLLHRERSADDLHAAGVEILVIAHLLLKDRLIILTDVFANRLAVRIMPDRDRFDVFVGVFFLGLLGHEAASLHRLEHLFGLLGRKNADHKRTVFGCGLQLTNFTNHV